MDVFPFFKLPLELRRKLYRNLARQRSSASAMIHTPPQSEAIRIEYLDIWDPRLLLLNKQFKDEYFQEVCQTSVRVHIRLAGPGEGDGEGGEDGGEDGGGDTKEGDEGYVEDDALPRNPESAIACLAHTPNLFVTGFLVDPDRRDVYYSEFQARIPGLLAALPRLQRVFESLFYHIELFEDMILANNLDVSSWLATQNGRCNKIIQDHAISRKVEFKPELILLSPLWMALDPEDGTQEVLVYYLARSMTEGEKKEHMWHGLDLKTLMQLDM